MSKRHYDPSLVEQYRRRAKLNEPLIRPLDIYSRVEYRCTGCGGSFFGNENHNCPVVK